MLDRWSTSGIKMNETSFQNKKDVALSGYTLAVKDEDIKTKVGTQALDTVEKTKENCDVFHPNHYTIGGIEVHDIIVSKKLSYDLGNAIKYILRAYYKGQEEGDLEKAITSIAMELDRIRVCKEKNEPWKPYGE